MRRERQVQYLLSKALGHKPIGREEALLLTEEVDPCSAETYASMATAGESSGEK